MSNNRARTSALYRAQAAYLLQLQHTRKLIQLADQYHARSDGRFTQTYERVVQARAVLIERREHLAQLLAEESGRTVAEERRELRESELNRSNAVVDVRERGREDRATVTSDLAQRATKLS